MGSSEDGYDDPFAGIYEPFSRLNEMDFELHGIYMDHEPRKEFVSRLDKLNGGYQIYIQKSDNRRIVARCELLRSNLGSTCKVGVTNNPDDKNYFKRFYICFKSLSVCWKIGCRKVIRLDGCFLKGQVQGELLTSIGRNANNQVFPIAWVVVDVEKKDNWTWFLELLRDDLVTTRNFLLYKLRNQAHQKLAKFISKHFWPDLSPFEYFILYSSRKPKIRKYTLEFTVCRKSQNSKSLEFTDVKMEFTAVNPKEYKYDT
uniref:MULE transposase domain-containing protein n=1 Tax=Lactuca sativa TaxID=4236 RepID=A0A9R1WAV9_LACSA|nr:hypothetical protein LSAT_V11C200052110 [Lactuca sativa]